MKFSFDRRYHIRYSRMKTVFVVGLCVAVGCLQVNATDRQSDSFKRGTMNSAPVFKELLHCSTFVDKSMLMAEFFKNTTINEYQLITCPHKFGKTVNLDMFRSFVEGGITNVSGADKMLSHSDSAIYQMFRKLKIASMLENTKGELYKDKFQQYIVIQVSFKTQGAKSYREILDVMCKRIKTCFEQYSRLYKLVQSKYDDWPRNPWIVPENLRGRFALLHRVLYGDMNQIDYNTGENDNGEGDIVNGLSELCKIFTIFYPDSKIFLLVDDYDNPVINAIEYNFDVKPVVGLICKFFSQLLNTANSNIQHALITGTLNIFKKSEFKAIKHWSFLDKHYFNQYFGLTEVEVDRLLESHGVSSNDRDVVKRFYQGYAITQPSTRIYNPFSIASYLSNRNPHNARLMLKDYWAGSSPISNFFRSLSKIEANEGLISELLKSNKTQLMLKKYWSSKDLIDLKEITHPKDTTKAKNIEQFELIFSYLFHQGYLSYDVRSKSFTLQDNEEIGGFVDRTCILNDKYTILLDKSEIKEKISVRSSP